MGECECISIEKYKVNDNVGWYLHLGRGSGDNEQLHGIVHCPYYGEELWD